MDISLLLEPQGKEEAAPPNTTSTFGPAPPSLPSPIPPRYVNRKRWSREEETLLIELRAIGMEWEDISKRLPGRNAASCCRHYQRKKIRFSLIYERYLELGLEILDSNS